MKWLSILIVVCATVAILAKDGEFVPCSELSRELRFPCRCALGPVEAALEGSPSISIDCDRVVFSGDFPVPFGAPVVSFRQRWSGQQALPTQVEMRKHIDVCINRKFSVVSDVRTSFTYRRFFGELPAANHGKVVVGFTGIVGHASTRR